MDDLLNDTDEYDDRTVFINSEAVHGETPVKRVHQYIDGWKQEARVMEFSEKLKSARKREGMSQEMLAEKLGVSRQAVTKWETNAGIPDIENLKAISALFDISIDELLGGEKREKQSEDYLFESVTEYDIDEVKHYDMKLGGANRLVVCGYDGEKVRVRLASDTISTLQNDFKVKIDDIRKRIDIEVNRKNGMTEARAKEEVTVFVKLPDKYVGKIELEANAQNVEAGSLKCDSIEMDVKTKNMILDGVVGNVEINCNLDMDVICRSINGAVEINQISATSRISIPAHTAVAVTVKGHGNSVTYERKGQPCGDFSVADAENMIQLNGLKSELIISVLDDEARS